ncbi:hypothetical protein ACFOY4_01405 [Actinomadura syzygii]|uniref:Uncharacterized protein n=1 Tax=Actinomadura syzygii TaxID=1427538 RepID=A0A5D0TTF4_9ACTN|nr:hypothetical protein [Actinomadura syzygii]TYC08595.1 hypothetical protein FXF65_37515 [Actinomadura syzygii]
MTDRYLDRTCSVPGDASPENHDTGFLGAPAPKRRSAMPDNPRPLRPSPGQQSPTDRYQIQVLRDTQQGWIPAVVDTVSYHPGERWYDDRAVALEEARLLRGRLTWADVRVVHKDAAGEITEVKS